MVAQDKPGRGDNRVLMWLGHYSMYLMAAALASTIAATALGNTWNLPGEIAALAWVIWSVSIFADSYYHESRLCERCIAATPLDTQAAVNRWRPVLRWQHRPVLRTLAILPAAAWMFWLVDYHPVPWWAWALTVVALAGYGSFFFSSYQHRKLYPWCPFCRWDDGGDEEAVPVLPVSDMSR